MRTRLVMVLALLLSPSPWGVAAAGEVAIVVSRDNPVTDLALKELVKIFRQEKQFWAAGKKIYLVMQETGTPEKTLVMKNIFQMADEELKKYWLEKVFKQEIASFPTTFSSNEAVTRFVSQVSNAIGFIDASVIDDRVKVLRIDGKLPGERGYALAHDVE